MLSPHLESTDLVYKVISVTGHMRLISLPEKSARPAALDGKDDSRPKSN